MSVLAFDTSTNAVSVCFVRDEGGEAFEWNAAPAALTGRPSHSSDLLPAIKHVMDAAGVRWDGVGAIAVGVGPGAFTGLRIGITTARALAHATGIPLYPASSLEALADGLDFDLQRLAVIDARRGEVFAALYDVDEVWEPFVTTAEALVERVRKEFPGAEKPQVAGDGAIRFRDVFEAAGLEVPPDDSHDHLVSANGVMAVASNNSPVAPEKLLPVYLREPDAKPQPQ